MRELGKEICNRYNIDIWQTARHRQRNRSTIIIINSRNITNLT